MEAKASPRRRRSRQHNVTCALLRTIRHGFAGSCVYAFRITRRDANRPARRGRCCSCYNGQFTP